jgi:hypothetical protein
VGVLHRAIGLARGTDAGGHLLKELREAKAVASDATVTVILQDLMDMPQDDPEHDDAIIVTYDHLLIVLNRAILGIE